jgi:hypothetical protein
MPGGDAGDESVAEPAPEVGEANHEGRPTIDFSPALGEAGHEVEELGYEGIPDSGPLLRTAVVESGPADFLDATIVNLPSD